MLVAEYTNMDTDFRMNRILTWQHTFLGSDGGNILFLFNKLQGYLVVQCLLPLSNVVVQTYTDLSILI